MAGEARHAQPHLRLYGLRRFTSTWHDDRGDLAEHGRADGDVTYPDAERNGDVRDGDAQPEHHDAHRYQPHLHAPR